jgi:uncharacterized protein YecE (DUF72 family)
VGVDATFYRFPTGNFWGALFGSTPSTFSVGLKVPEHIKVARWPAHVRYGARAGRDNEHFLDAAVFTRSFVKPLEPYQSQVGICIFEFGAFSRKDFQTIVDFLGLLDPFLGALPQGWPYAVEIRNADYLVSDYFAVLRRHHVAHVFNAWTRMPRIADQITIPGAFTTDFTVVRALLQKGRTYEQAVGMFEPYRQLQEPDPATRGAMRRIADMVSGSGHRVYIFVNNRLEGFAPATIEAVVSDMPVGH